MQAPRLIRYLQSSLWALGAIVAVALGCNDPSFAAPRQRIDAQALGLPCIAMISAIWKIGRRKEGPAGPWRGTSGGAASTSDAAHRPR